MDKDKINANVKTENLLKHARLFLEDCEWSTAIEYCDAVIDLEQKNAEAYLLKLMAELKVSKKEELYKLSEPFDNKSSYKKIQQLGDAELVDELEKYNELIKRNVEREKLYVLALKRFNQAVTEEHFRLAKESFEKIADYKDSNEKIFYCRKKIEEARNESIYKKALFLKNQNTEKGYEEAAFYFRQIRNYKDSKEHVEFCERIIGKKIESDKEKTNIPKKEKIQKHKKMIFVFAAISIAAIAVISFVTVIRPMIKYHAAVAFMEDGKYDEAITAFRLLDGYKDSEEQIRICENEIQESNYQFALALVEEGRYEEAAAVFRTLNGYRDSNEQIENCEKGIKYNSALLLMEEGRYEEAVSGFESLGDYKDSAEQIINCKNAILESEYIAAVEYMENGKLREAIKIFAELDDYKDSREQFSMLLKKINRELGKNTISAAYNHTIGLKSDGKVVSIGNNYYGEGDVYGWNNIVSISAGYSHTLGLKADGTVVATGYNGVGECDVSGWRNIVAVSAGLNYSIGLKSDGTVVATGYNDEGRCDVYGWTDIVAISAGSYHTVGLKSDGTVVAVGFDGVYECDVSDWTDIYLVDAGVQCTVGLKSDGTVVATGLNDFGQCEVSDWIDIVAISTGNRYTVGLKSDGTVVATGLNDRGQCDVSGWTDIVAISVGWNYTLGLKSDGTVVATGNNNDGQCDVYDWWNIKVPELW